MELQHRQQFAFFGMLVGGILGGLAALLWLDNFSDAELEENRVTKVGYGDMARLATATVAIVRQINALAKEEDKQ